MCDLDHPRQEHEEGSARVSTVAERRLDSAVSGLTAKERARIWYRWWCTSETPNELLREHMPGSQAKEFDQIIAVLEQATSGFYECALVWTEWVRLAEVELAWLESVSGLKGRVDVLTKALRARKVSVREEGAGRRHGKNETIELPTRKPPDIGHRRDLPLMWGSYTGEDGDPPATWAELHKWLRVRVRTAIESRWQELEAAERALKELGEWLGEALVHPDVRQGFDRLRAKLLFLHEEAQPYTGVFKLPEPEQEHLVLLRGRIDWDQLEVVARPEGSRDRSRLPENQRDALEAAEEEWIASVRTPAVR